MQMKTKANLSNLTIVMTCRIDSKSRMNNFKATFEYYRLYSNACIIVLEADDCPKLSFLNEINDNRVQYIFVRDYNPIFHRTHYINVELATLKTSNAACIDVDVIVPIEQLSQANALLTETDEVMVLPYDGRFVAEDDARSDLFRQTKAIESLTTLSGYVQLLFGYISVGGAFLCNVERYRKYGWENEYFIGWGPEDYERFMRLDILGKKPKQIEGVIYHLNHPRGNNSGNFVEHVVLTTKREYCKVCSMTTTELRNYIDTWPWIN